GHTRPPRGARSADQGRLLPREKGISAKQVRPSSPGRSPPRRSALFACNDSLPAWRAERHSRRPLDAGMLWWRSDSAIRERIRAAREWIPERVSENNAHISVAEPNVLF